MRKFLYGGIDVQATLDCEKYTLEQLVREMHEKMKLLTCKNMKTPQYNRATAGKLEKFALAPREENEDKKNIDDD